jgi:hypothetical protein
MYQYVFYYANQMRTTNDEQKRREYERILAREISEYRLTAYKNQGTNVAKICNKEANFIEKLLENIKKEL